MIARETIEEAHQRIRPYIHQTPLMTSASVDAIAGCQVFFKCENFQKAGSFKSRGAMNALLSLDSTLLRNGVATHSSGNHAQALARAAKIAGVRSFIVMPSTAPLVKKRGVAAYGGEIFECSPTLAARESALQEVVEQTGAAVIHPFDNDAVIAGQATAAKEMFEQAGAFDVIITPVGGGGLLSGTCLSAHFFCPEAIVIAGEPEGADDAYRSLLSGQIEPSAANTIADGLLTTLSPRTFAIIRKYVDSILTVSDDEIIAAMRLIWERLKIIVEPSGAVPFAALLKNKERFTGKKVGIILSGGNTDLAAIARLFT